MPRHRSNSSSPRSGQHAAAWPWLLLWGAGVIALIGTCTLLHVPRIERKILADVQSAVAPIVSAPVMVAVDGHTATITGPAADASERDALLTAIADSNGVRTVIDELTIAAAVAGPVDNLAPAPPEAAVMLDAPDTVANADLPPESVEPDANGDPGTAQEQAAAPLPSLALRIDGRALTLDGHMNVEDDLTTLIQIALEAFDPSYLTNRIDTTQAAAPADWMTALAALMPDLAELDDPAVDITERQITLAGSASSRELHDRVIDTALEAFDGYALLERIEIATTAVPAATPELPDAAARVVLQRSDTSSVPLPASDQPVAIQDPPDETGSAQALQRALADLGGQRILFERGSYVLGDGSESRLDALATLFNQYPEVGVEIEGHTDNTGSADANLSLSQRRASAVLGALIERGVSRTRLVAYGYGEGLPLVDNSTPEGRARNRRIEFRF